MAWMGTWSKRIKIELDNSKVDSELSNFPTLVHLSASSGYNSDDVSAVFDELTSDDNRKKIAVTSSDGTTQQYVEIEKWDDANEQAWLWTKVGTVNNGAVTTLYLYYDSAQDDNTTYVGDTNSTPAETVWDANYIGVWHLGEPSGTTCYDSTDSSYDLTKKGDGEPNPIAGQADGAQDFDGTDDVISKASIADTDFLGDITVQMLANIDTGSAYRHFAGKHAANGATAAPFDFRTGNEATPTMQLVMANTGYKTHAGPAVTLSSYKFYAFTHTGNIESGVNFFINDSKTASTPGGSGSGAPTGSTADLRFGVRTDAAVKMNGKMDEIRISKSVRTDAWLKADYNSCFDLLNDFYGEETIPVNDVTGPFPTFFRV